jgi:hypothetical protein
MQLPFSSTLEAAVKVDQSAVDKPEPWWEEARKQWGKALQSYSTNYRVLYSDPDQIREMLPQFSNQAFIFGPMGSSKVERIGFDSDEALVIDTKEQHLNAPVDYVEVIRGGLAKWNTYLLVHFESSPSIWSEFDFKGTKPWAMIAHSTSAYCIYKKYSPFFPYEVGPTIVDGINWNIGVGVDLFILDDDPWPCYKKFPELWTPQVIHASARAK